MFNTAKESRARMLALGRSKVKAVIILFYYQNKRPAAGLSITG